MYTSNVTGAKHGRSGLAARKQGRAARRPLLDVADNAAHVGGLGLSQRRLEAVCEVQQVCGIRLQKVRLRLCRFPHCTSCPDCQWDAGLQMQVG